MAASNGGTHSDGDWQRTRYVLAIEDWHSAVATDLSFQQGDVIAVSGKSGAWWQGTLNGQSGDIPETYVRELRAPPRHFTLLTVAPRRSFARFT